MTSRVAGARRRLRLAATLLTLIVVVGTVYVADSLTGGTLFGHPYQVSLMLPDAGGLHTGSNVTYRGQQIGRVQDVTLTARGLVAHLSIDQDARIPRASAFEVRNLSAVGEQYVDVRPRTSKGPNLRDGDVVPADHASVPLRIDTLVTDSQRLLAAIHPRDLNTIAQAARAVFADGSVDLPATVRQLQASVSLLRSLTPDLMTLTVRGRTLLQVGADSSRDLTASAHDLAAFTHTLSQHTRDFSRGLGSTGRLLPLLEQTWRRLRPTLSGLLEQTVPVAAMTGVHVPGLRVWLEWLPAQLAVMAASTRDGSGHVELVPKPLRNCYYSRSMQPPSDPTPRLPLANHCSTYAQGVQGRGAQYAPAP